MPGVPQGRALARRRTVVYASRSVKGNGSGFDFPEPSAATLLSGLECQLTEPLVEPDVAQSRFAPRNQRTLTELRPEVPRVRISDNLAWVVVGGEALTDQFVETELLRTSHFNGAVHWGAYGDSADRLGDVLSRHRLKEHRRQADRRSDGGFIGNAFDELEKQRGVHDRVRDPAAFDQRLLSVLRAKVRTVRYALGSTTDSAT